MKITIVIVTIIKNNNKTRTIMKKQILALSFGVVSLGAFAQKAELKAAEKAIKKQKWLSI